MNFFLLNTDNRLVHLHKLLTKKNKISFLYNFEEIIENCKSKDIVVLPPNFKWTQEQAEILPENITIVCGNAKEEVRNIFELKNIYYYNLMEDETFVLKNASLTAEGFLVDLILNTPASIFNQKILLLGGGRVAKAVGLLLNKLGIDYDISMRNEIKLLEFQLYAKNIIKFKNFKQKLKNYDTIINTIPAEIFFKKDENKFKNDSILFELSSVKCLNSLLPVKTNSLEPFTEIIKINKLKNLKYVLSPALPGRYLPNTAGELIYEYLKSKSLFR